MTRRAKAYRSRAARTSARLALVAEHKKESQDIPKRHPQLTAGARWIHGGPDQLQHPRWTR